MVFATQRLRLLRFDTRSITFSFFTGTTALVGPGLFFFLLFSRSWTAVGLLGRVISSSQGLYLYTNTEKRTYTNIKHPCPEWDSNHGPGFERSKTVHALDRSATVTGAV
jgi:hypothetical protein